jgi:RNA polymerase sigma factor (sigma-70 family)
LGRRVGDRELAEDILQDAFTKVIDRPEYVPADEGVVPWFYRTLRNAAIDQLRRRGTASRAIEACGRIVRHVRRARLPKLHVPDPLFA